MKAAKTFQLIIGVPGGAALMTLFIHWTSIIELPDEMIAICIGVAAFAALLHAKTVPVARYYERRQSRQNDKDKP